MKLPAATWVRQKLFLSYYFTKKRPSKIFKIENFNRQTHNKKCTDFHKINVFSSQNIDLTLLETRFKGVIHMPQQP